MLDIDTKFLLEFENQLNPADPTSGDIPVKILGYGEISTTFQIGDINNIAFKRMPPFPSEQARAYYCSIVDEYCKILTEIGVNVVEYSFAKLTNSTKEHIVYIIQPKLEKETIGNQIIKQFTDNEFEIMLTKIFENIAKVWKKNKKDESGELLGLDSQISNWAFTKQVLNGKKEPIYFDISTPIFRKNGNEMIDMEVFIKSIPFFLVWIVKKFFIKEILDRYYDLRFVSIDIIANLYKEGQPFRIPLAIKIANQFFESKASYLNICPINREEIDKYYKEDKFIWSFLLISRKLDRFIKTKILKQKYDFILPGYIKR
jgi:hypothetical protein